MSKLSELVAVLRQAVAEQRPIEFVPRVIRYGHATLAPSCATTQIDPQALLDGLAELEDLVAMRDRLFTAAIEIRVIASGKFTTPGTSVDREDLARVCYAIGEALLVAVEGPK